MQFQSNKLPRDEGGPLSNERLSAEIALQPKKKRSLNSLYEEQKFWFWFIGIAIAILRILIKMFI